MQVNLQKEMNKHSIGFVINYQNFPFKSIFRKIAKIVESETGQDYVDSDILFLEYGDMRHEKHLNVLKYVCDDGIILHSRKGREKKKQVGSSIAA